MKLKYVLPLVFMLMACSPEPTSSAPIPSPQANSIPEASPPVVTASPAIAISEAQIQAFLTSKTLDLQVNEELMLIGDIQLDDGTRRSFDQVQNLITITNNHPDLLSLDLKNRLIKALKAGTATVELAVRDHPTVKVLVTIKIAAVTPGIDPNIALVDVEIQ